jgi:hypothetical protein
MRAMRVPGRKSPSMAVLGDLEYGEGTPAFSSTDPGQRSLQQGIEGASWGLSWAPEQAGRRARDHV